jgi:hypothetical protein
MGLMRFDIGLSDSNQRPEARSVEVDRVAEHEAAPKVLVVTDGIEFQAQPPPIAGGIHRINHRHAVSCRFVVAKEPPTGADNEKNASHSHKECPEHYLSHFRTPHLGGYPMGLMKPDPDPKLTAMIGWGALLVVVIVVVSLVATAGLLLW